MQGWLGLARAGKKRKNRNKGNLVILAQSVTKTNNSLKTDKYMTAIHTMEQLQSYTQSVFRLLFVFVTE